MSRSNSAVVVVGNFPPPLGGAAQSTLRFSGDLKSRGADVYIIDGSIGGLAHGGSVVTHVRRGIRFVANLWRLQFRIDAPVVYFVANAGYGLIYSLFYGCILRFKRVQLFVHHHSYAYITRWSPLMNAFLKIVGPSAIHIFGDEAMGSAFDSAYSVRTSKRFACNAATMELPTARRKRNGGLNEETVRVGYLSNLCREKGFDVVVDMFTQLASKSSQYTFSIAGAPMSAIDKILLDHLCIRLGSRLRYYGPVTGAKKSDFYGDIDIFVFPTRFKQEAQPFVVYEALAVGAFVLATRRAGIPAMLEGFPSVIIPESQYIAQTMVRAIENLSTDGDISAHSDNIRTRFLQIQRTARERYDALLSEMLTFGEFKPGYTSRPKQHYEIY